jgi:4-amino-4-deoxy-L-arabinose transferase-like glycosyltransferase
MRMKVNLWTDTIFLLILSLYVWFNAALVPFHGDEAMQIYAANDYFTRLYRDPAQLTTQPPYAVDSDAHLRILNGSVNRYAIGVALEMYFVKWWDIPFPPAPGWQWVRSYEDNAAQGYLPESMVLMIARLPSLLFHIASVIMMFALSRALGGRPLAYVATLIYALHPVLLLNGRRALQESEMIFFGLLALWCAAKITSWANRQSIAADAKNGIPTESSGVETPFMASATHMKSTHDAPHKASANKHAPLALWALLTLACGLTLASKHSGIVFVAAAAGWVMIGSILPIFRTSSSSPRLRVSMFLLLRQSACIAVVLLLALGLFIALSPALWNDPPTRLGDLLQVRAELINSQVIALRGATPLTERLTALLTQPFLAAPQFYEAPTFNVEPIHQSITTYLNTPFAGVQNAPLLGITLTLLALVGIIAPLARPGWQIISPTHVWGLLLTLLIIVASLLVNPLPWQRYYLALMTITCIYAALGVLTFMRARTIWHDNRKQVMR